MGHDASILITIDPETTAVLMMKPEDKLSAELWTSNLSELSLLAHSSQTPKEKK